MAVSSNIITNIKNGSIAEELGIEIGDILLSINGQKVNDIIDYKYLISDEYIELSILKKDGGEWIFEVEKEYDEDLGLEFENPTIDAAKRCANKCIFCFIDQLPKGMRETLYFKDDDSRLSFLQGNFITMTNMSEHDIERIIKYRISPLNISVHTTNPTLRVMMLKNKRAGNIMDLLKKLTESGIEINCQIVLVRGINDGEELRKTIFDLFSMYPKIKNVAVVPVGITKYREGLYPLIPYDEESSSDLLGLIEHMQKEIYKSTKDVFVRAADEFYIMANRELPGPEHYGNFEQLEDGVGMVTYFLENIRRSLRDINVFKVNKEISLITGKSAFEYIKKACSMIQNNIDGLKISVYRIENSFFGDKITVTGLLTGKDIIEQLKGKNLGEKLLLPSNVLKFKEQIFLDDVTVDDLKRELNIPVEICKFDGSDFLENILK